MDESEQQKIFDIRFNAAKKIAGSFAQMLDKAIIAELMKGHVSQPKPDAKCSALKGLTGVHREKMPSGGIMVCACCQGTDREPIPTREVIQHE